MFDVEHLHNEARAQSVTRGWAIGPDSVETSAGLVEEVERWVEVVEMCVDIEVEHDPNSAPCSGNRTGLRSRPGEQKCHCHSPRDVEHTQGVFVRTTRASRIEQKRVGLQRSQKRYDQRHAH